MKRIMAVAVVVGLLSVAGCSSDAPITVNGYTIEPSANLVGANLTGADLTDAWMPGANLEGANLTGANLGHANLTDANLTGANLVGAYVYYADLTDADLTDADLHRVFMDGATMPDGKKIPLTIGSTIDIPEYFTALTDKELNALQDEIAAALKELAIRQEMELSDDEWGQQMRLEEALANIVSEQNRRGR